jgi:CRP-like cAMP-binding protein
MAAIQPARMANDDTTTESTESAKPIANRLLRTLSRSDYEALVPHLEPLALPVRMVLFEPGADVTHAYFPASGMASLVNEMKDGTVEVGTVGNEGMVGTPILLQSKSMTTRTFMQLSGAGHRIAAEPLRRMIRQSPDAERLFFRYAQTMFDQLAQWVACNRLHMLEARCARWLLMTSDRAGGDSFTLTHEFLSYMLGVHRPAVSLVASELSERGLLKYRRGAVTIMDRAGLEATSCQCYAIARRSMEMLFAESAG